MTFIGWFAINSKTKWLKWQLSNEVINRCCASINLDRIFNGFVATSNETLFECIQCCQSWKEIYDKVLFCGFKIFWFELFQCSIFKCLIFWFNLILNRIELYIFSLQIWGKYWWTKYFIMRQVINNLITSKSASYAYYSLYFSKPSHHFYIITTNQPH